MSNKKKVKKRIANLVFVAVIALALVTGFVFILAAPVDVNEYENRTAEKLEGLGHGNYFNSKFQDSVEAAAGDQIPFAISAKKGFNERFSRFTGSVLSKMIEREARREARRNPDAPDVPGDSTESAITTGGGIEDTTGSGVVTGGGVEKKIPVPVKPANSGANPPTYSEKYLTVGDSNGSYKLYRGQLMYGTYGAESMKSSLLAHAKNVNEIAAAHPDVRVCAFYLEKETNMRFDTGFRNEYGEYLLGEMNIPEKDKAMTKVESFDVYDSEFYATDHHWNYKGSYRGYVTALAMLLPNEEPLIPTDAVFIGVAGGSLTNTSDTASFTEEVYAYDFDFPAMSFTVNGNSASDYGSLKDVVSTVKSGGTVKKMAYGNLYGYDYKELIVDNLEDTGNGNILVLGSSYDNACIKLLASHYDKLYSLDMRYWEVPKDSDGNKLYDRYNSFKLAEYIKENDIKTVLFFGDDWFWTGKTFNIYDK